MAGIIAPRRKCEASTGEVEAIIPEKKKDMGKFKHSMHPAPVGKIPTGAGCLPPLLFISSSLVHPSSSSRLPIPITGNGIVARRAEGDGESSAAGRVAVAQQEGPAAEYAQRVRPIGIPVPYH